MPHPYSNDNLAQFGITTNYAMAVVYGKKWRGVVSLGVEDGID